MAFLSVLIVLSLGCAGHAYNILIIYPTPSISHQTPIMTLTEALVNKGHQLFVASPNQVPGLERNYTWIDFSASYIQKKINFGNPELLNNLILNWDALSVFPNYAMTPVALFRSEPFSKFQKRVKEENITFDVAIVESLYTPHLCAMTRYLTGGKPIITLSTVGMDFYPEDNLGSIFHKSYTPSPLKPYTNKMSLLEKIDNWISISKLVTGCRSIMEESARNFFRDTYGPEYEPLVDGCWSNASLAMISSNSLYFYPRPLGPNIIELGPLHIKPPGKLSKILEDWLDGAEKGVIYMSLGSNMQSTFLSNEAVSNLVEVFKDLPPGYRILWKWENDAKIAGQSNNILTQTWLPQQSILAHPKTKLFITQGGLQSFQEAVHYGVPVVGIPYFADQVGNVARMVDLGIGVRLEPSNLNSYKKIQEVIRAALMDESYSKNIKRLSAISQDFTSQAVDKAVFWVEHVAKHGGAHHLRPSTAETTYFEYCCLDILSVILVLTVTFTYTVISFVKFLISLVFFTPKSKIIKTS